ncbi:Abi family protein [Comamonas jiangduensis]|uniref:Abi family protein n=1 Tax=Comamonas jiangduensis TaxID=1194168 RepID=UPI002896F488|nr:Abi family protein [Comamonas jiangduensis]
MSVYWYDFRVRGEPFCPLDAETGRKPQKVQLERPVLDAFKPSARFHDAVDWYVFDKKLRLLALDCIEVALRVDLSRRLGEKDPFSYLNKKTNM